MAAVLLPHLNRIRIPAAGQKVHKDEAAFSFDTPESEEGLYVCMNSFLGLGRRHVDMYFQKTSNAVFLHIKRIRREIVTDSVEAEAKKKPTRLAIGIEGGFDTGDRKFDVEEFFSIVVLPDWTEFPLTFPDLPVEVTQSASAIIAASSAAREAELAAMAGAWDGEERQVSRFADNLDQLVPGKKIPPSGWMCERCGMKENLWLNLTDGSILCGRKFWDGSGGNNHAIDHYNNTKYPLAVKLGTITPDGADVYSYPEDDMVSDPQLPKHLAHFGIDLMKMEKTDRTMTEMELDLNQRVWEWNVLQESGSKLQPIYGPGCTGIYNLGNSCYMNSIMQVVFTLPSFVDRYYKPATQIFVECNSDPTTDFNVQMAKFGHGLLSGDYSKPPTGTQNVQLDGIRPRMFRSLIGIGHPEFSTNRQQDAVEYLLHLITTIERTSRGAACPSDNIRFRLEDRIECGESHRVKYMYRDDYTLSLPVPLDKAINLSAVAAYEAKKAAMELENREMDSAEEVVRPRLQLSACIDAFAAPVFVENFFSSAVRTHVTAKKSTLISTFPEYLFLHVQKFTVGADWVERKLDVSIDVPDELDISHLRATGKQATEEELPEDDGQQQQQQQQQQRPPGPAPVGLNIDEGHVMQLVDMGFPLEACKKAIYHTRNNGIEAAMNWIMEHMDDPDFADALQVEVSRSGSDQFLADEGSVNMIMAMGFTKTQATVALKATDNNLERAADWIFSHAMELENPVEEMMDGPVAPAPANQAPAANDGPGRYSLAAFVSHMGTSTKCGHYVCHILKEGRWVIFNDDKVALSENPPKDLAYLYVYRRMI